MLICTSLLKAQAEQDWVLNEPRLERRDAFPVAGIQVRDVMEQDVLMKLWMDFMELRHLIPDPVSPVEYGISYYGEDFDPETETGYYYLVAQEVKALDDLPEPLVGHTVPAGNYLVFEHRGSIHQIQNSFGYIFGKYFQNSKFIPARQDVFELYDERFAGESPDSVVEIWVPVHIDE